MDIERHGFGFAVDIGQQRAFSAISGDDNPIHLDPAVAAAHGFDGPVVYGALILGQVSRLIGTVVPGHGALWHDVRIDFRAPLVIDRPAELAATVEHRTDALGIVRLAFAVTAKGRMIASGSATASRRPTP
ncbi:MAG: MaoC/PaaZ C-terminal domain-containing protein [Rhodospirillales bacterium]